MRLGVHQHYTVPQRYLNLLQAQQHFNAGSMPKLFIPVMSAMHFQNPSTMLDGIAQLCCISSARNYTTNSYPNIQTTHYS